MNIIKIAEQFSKLKEENEFELLKLQGSGERNRKHFSVIIHHAGDKSWQDDHV